MKEGDQEKGMEVEQKVQSRSKRRRILRDVKAAHPKDQTQGMDVVEPTAAAAATTDGDEKQHKGKVAQAAAATTSTVPLVAIAGRVTKRAKRRLKKEQKSNDMAVESSAEK